jgi:large subunit ribosomal protein L25
MSEKFTLQAELRHDLGKGASRRLRRLNDLVPAVIYGLKKPALSLTLVHKDVMKLTQDEAFYSSILEVEIDGKKVQAVLKDMQRHPSKERILHLDFLRINAKEKLTMNVPLHFIGEDVCVGVKMGGKITKLMTELVIECLPSNLPESIDIDVTDMPLNTSLHIKDIVLPKGTELAHAIEDEAHNHPVISIAEPRLQAEETEEAIDVPAADVPSKQKEDGPDKA